MREIGSEFWLDKNNIEDKNNALWEMLDFGKEQQLLFTGRTAINYVLEDITKPIKTVYMPSYCCNSMLQPFIDKNIGIYFYDVIPNGGGIEYLVDYEKDVDLFFAISYFGYSRSAMDSIIKAFSDRNIPIIEDITHRLLSNQNHCNKSDYCIASLRKWFAIPTGGLAIKMKDTFRKQNMMYPSTELLDKKVNGMTQKAEYMLNSNDESSHSKKLKYDFLKSFSEFNTSIQLNYKNIIIDDLSKHLLARIDVEDIKKRRYKNAQYLHKYLEESEYIKFLFDEISIKEDCPLFVPLMVRENIREALQNYLISNNIYCPVHWPVPKGYKLNIRTERLYNEELSLICDQRYGYDDMEKITNTLGEFIKNYDRYIF